jgi:hypothetical protein
MWIGVLCALGTLALLWAVRGNRLRLFGLLWFLAGFAPSAQVLPHHVFRADRFLYIPMAGLAILIAGLFTPQPQRTAPAAGREERSGVQEGSG